MNIAAHRFNNDLRYRDDAHPMQRQLTPSYVLEPIRKALGSIELDPCTEPDNPTRATMFYTPPVDGADEPWDAATIYVNPPYSKARERWVNRCIEAAATGSSVALLMPSHTDTRLFHRAIGTASHVVFIRGRVKFGVLRSNRRQEAASHPSCVILWNVADVSPMAHLGAVWTLSEVADAVAGNADDSVPEAVRAWREVARLRQWKEEATAVLAEWDKVHYECAGASAHIGRTKAENVRRELQRLRGQCEVWMNGVADVVEPWGYDRRAASGPADLLPGLTSIAERLSECVEARRYLYEQVVELTAKPPAPGLRDGIRERPSTWPSDSGDPVEDRNLPAAPPEVGDDPAGSDGSTATRGPAVGTGESPVLARHRVIPQPGSNLCVCGEWFDAEVHQFPEPVRFWNVGHDDPHNHYPWTWTPNLPDHGGPVLGSIHTPNGPRPDGGMHALLVYRKPVTARSERDLSEKGQATP